MAVQISDHCVSITELFHDFDKSLLTTEAKVLTEKLNTRHRDEVAVRVFRDFMLYVLEDVINTGCIFVSPVRELTIYMDKDTRYFFDDLDEMVTGFDHAYRLCMRSGYQDRTIRHCFTPKILRRIENIVNSGVLYTWKVKKYDEYRDKIFDKYDYIKKSELRNIIFHGFRRMVSYLKMGCYIKAKKEFVFCINKTNDYSFWNDYRRRMKCKFKAQFSIWGKKENDRKIGYIVLDEQQYEDYLQLQDDDIIMFDNAIVHRTEKSVKFDSLKLRYIKTPHYLKVINNNGWRNIAFKRYNLLEIEKENIEEIWK